MDTNADTQEKSGKEATFVVTNILFQFGKAKMVKTIPKYCMHSIMEQWGRANNVLYIDCSY